MRFQNHLPPTTIADWGRKRWALSISIIWCSSGGGGGSGDGVCVHLRHTVSFILLTLGVRWKFSLEFHEGIFTNCKPDVSYHFWVLESFESVMYNAPIHSEAGFRRGNWISENCSNPVKILQLVRHRPGFEPRSFWHHNPCSFHFYSVLLLGRVWSQSCLSYVIFFKSSRFSDSKTIRRVMNTGDPQFIFSLPTEDQRKPAYRDTLACINV